MPFRATIAELLAFILVWVLVFSFIPGCGTQEPPGQPEAVAKPEPLEKGPAVKADASEEHEDAQTLSGEQVAVQLPAQGEEEPAAETEPVASAEPGDAETSPETSPGNTYLKPLREVNESAIEAAGIHKLTGKHITLYTDLPVGDEIAELPQVFDQAYDLWCNAFGLDPEKHAAWQMRATLIGDKNRFQNTDLLRDDLPPFRNGFARGGELWLYEQPSDYYRRHLLLHEGTHGFMDMLLGGAGPPWYMEGMAELLATHTWEDGKLTLNVMPDDKEKFEMLGRIKIVQEGTAEAGGPKPLVEILNYSSRAHLENEPYGWCWALCAFLDRHPAYQERFHELQTHVTDHQFNRHFMEAFRADWSELNTEWQLFAATLEHGHDLLQTALEFPAEEPLAEGSKEVTVDAQRGWQPAGVKLRAGQKYKLTAAGQFQIAMTDQPWISEAGGVTIRYYHGQPLGMLLAAVVDKNQVAADGSGHTALLSPVRIGLEGELTPDQDGSLYLQVNDSAGERGDNEGELQVAIATE